MPFNIALSGLNAAATSLEVTGNNIANSATTGFKESRAEFVDVYALSYQGISDLAVGSGVRTAAITQSFGQGPTSYTDNSLDLMINGPGFFRVRSPNGDEYLTRAGEFHVDRENTIVNNRGQHLLGYPGGAVGVTPTPITLDTTTGAAQATTELEGIFNLPTLNTTPIDPVTVPFISTDPETYHEQTATTIYDSHGTPLSANFFYRRIEPVGANQWEVYAFVEGQPLPPNFPPPPVTVPPTPAPLPTDPVIVQFNTDGSLNNVSPAVTGNPASIDYDPITIIAGTDPLDLTFDMRGSTQLGIAFDNTISQDGYPPGELTSIDIDEAGVVFARYTNGQSDELATLAMMAVVNPHGLAPAGDSNWRMTYAAGDPIMGTAQSSRIGSIESGALEASNVDVAEQLVNLITAQRNYQANAQVISTADTVTQTIINIR